MHVDVIRQAVRRQPFRPFTLRMNDGWEFHVPHPEYVAVAPRHVYYVHPVTGAGTFLEPVLIASLHEEGDPSRPASEKSDGGNP